MNLQYLIYALEVEKTGSISKAAENLYMNQPNLSKAIKDLENMLGAQLFRRTTKGISSTTEDGRVFMEYARKIVFQFDEMKAYFGSEIFKKRALRVSIPRASYITEALTEFIAGLGDMDDVHISFRETNSYETIDGVADGGYSIGIVRCRTMYENYFLTVLRQKALEFREILAANSVVIMSSRAPLAARESLCQEDLEKMIEISNDDFSMPNHFLDDKFRVSPPPRGKQIFVYERGSQFDILARIPKTFMWVSPMPRDVLKRNGLVQKACASRDTGFKDILIHRRRHIFGELESSFMDKIEQVKAEIMSGRTVRQ